MASYCYATLGFNCMVQSCALTSNEKYLPPEDYIYNNTTTSMVNYPCQKCQYVTRDVRKNLPPTLQEIQDEAEDEEERNEQLRLQAAKRNRK